MNSQESGFTMSNLSQSTLESGLDFDYYVANSSIVRAFDSWNFTRAITSSDFEMNRGASGIEGQISTAIGYSRFTNRPQLTFIGDVTAIHDLNSFLELSKTKSPHVVVILNNSGGHIFDKLPISKYENVLNPFMSTPHSYTFKGLSEMAKISYCEVDNIADYKKALTEAHSRNEASIVECRVSSSKEVELFNKIKGI